MNLKDNYIRDVFYQTNFINDTLKILNLIAII